LKGQQFQYLTVSDGLSSRHIYGVEQDRKGFIWIATSEGIDRYDGNELRHYKLYNNAIMPTDIGYRFNVVIDTYGYIWAYTTSGKIFKFSKNEDKFNLIYDAKSAFQSPQSNPYVYNLFFDSANNMWIGTSLGICYAISGDSNHLSFLPGSASKTSSFEEVQAGDILAGTSDGIKLIRINEASEAKIFPNGNISIVTKEISTQSLFFDKQNNVLWIGTASSGPSVYDFKDSALIDLGHLTQHVPIRSIVKDFQDRILIGLDGAGIVTVNSSNYQKIDKLEKGESDAMSLIENSVLDIHCDNEGRIWVATWSGGITIMDFQKPKLQFINYQNNEKNSLRNNQVNSIFEDSGGLIWFGTNSGVSVYDPERKKWNHLAGVMNIENISNYKILAIEEDSNGRIWIGSYANGAHCYDKVSRKLIDYSTKIGIEYIYSVFFDGNDCMWFGGMEKNLVRLDLNSDETFKCQLSNITTIINKDPEQLWVGSTTGLTIVNKNTGITKPYSTKKSDKNLISNQYINCLFQDSSNLLWIGTNGGGLNCYDPVSDSIEVYSVVNGLPSNFIYGVYSDKKGRLWVSTEMGIACFDPKLKTCVGIGNIDGFTNHPYNRNAYARIGSDELAFGGPNGAVLFEPEKISSYPGASHLIINEFKLSYQTVLPGDKGSPLELPIDETSSIRLKYDQKSFSFIFSSINFNNPDQFGYQWKLDGFEADWAPFTNNNMAVYTNIPPGDYDFILRSVNRNNLEISDEKSLHIKVDTPFWMTYLAYTIYVFIVSGLIFMFYLIAKNRLDKKHSADKIRFFINTAHDIKTPTSLIIAPLKDIEADKGLTKEGAYYLKLAQSNAERLLGIINQVLDFDKVESKKAQLVVSSNNLNLYMEDKLESFKSLADRKEIILKYSINTDEAFVDFDQGKMDKIIDNILSNAIKYTPENGNVKVNVKVDEKEWTVEISDTGIGIPKKAQRELFKMYYRAENAINSQKPGSGLGLMLAKSLIQMHGGKISFTSQEGVGTTFKLNIPIKRSSKLSGAVSHPKVPTALIQNRTRHIDYTISPQKLTVIPESQIKILVVEDDNELQDYLVNSLGSRYHVKSADDGQIALDKIRNERFDLVISDVMMPNLRGDELCRILKEDIDTSHIPVILLTALADKKSTISGFESGADNYVNKPFDIEIIFARIDNLLKNRELIRENILKGIAPGKNKVSINNLDEAFIQNMLSIVEKELTNPDFSVLDLCKEVGMSRTLVYEKVKALTNLAPNEFIRTIRMNRAMDLLKSGEHAINEVAYLIGFEDPKYFSTAFKKFFGKSPKNFSRD
jgi:signal transduction histidine kinase/ligand-binding sensor domain-containing protein/DNA-binding response OmpR family regulator